MRACRSLLSVFVMTLLVGAASNGALAEEPLSAAGSPLGLAQGEHVRQQVDDTADQVDDTADDTADRVDDTADDAADQVDETADDAEDRVRDTVDSAGGEVSGAANEVTRDASRASDGAVGEAGNLDGDPTSSEVANYNEPTGSEAREIAGAGHDVSGESTDEALASESADSPNPGLLTLTGTRGLIFAAAVGLLLVAVGAILLAARRRGRRSTPA
jgi:hypothetical protein